jgi:outer membrane receptor for Fe3+-dicitrate
VAKVGQNTQKSTVAVNEKSPGKGLFFVVSQEVLQYFAVIGGFNKLSVVRLVLNGCRIKTGSIQ